MTALPAGFGDGYSILMKLLAKLSIPESSRSRHTVKRRQDIGRNLLLLESVDRMVC